jgi:hypothetical protein
MSESDDDTHGLEEEARRIMRDKKRAEREKEEHKRKEKEEEKRREKERLRREKEATRAPRRFPVSTTSTRLRRSNSKVSSPLLRLVKCVLRGYSRMPMNDSQLLHVQTAIHGLLQLQGTLSPLKFGLHPERRWMSWTFYGITSWMILTLLSRTMEVVLQSVNLPQVIIFPHRGSPNRRLPR